MPYRGANSSARKAIAAYADGTRVQAEGASIAEQTMKAVTEAVTKGQGFARPAKGYARARGMERAMRPVKYELQRVGLKARKLAQLLADTAAKVYDPDPQQVALGLNAIRILLKVRGDLSPTPMGRGHAQPTNVNVLIGVLRELGGRYHIPDVVGPETSATHNDSLACEVVDVTPEEPES